MKSPAWLLAAALCISPLAFAEEDPCETRLDQLEEAMDNRELSDTQKDQVDTLKEQAENYQDDKMTAECVSAVDQAMQVLDNAPMQE